MPAELLCRTPVAQAVVIVVIKWNRWVYRRAKGVPLLMATACRCYPRGISGQKSLDLLWHRLKKLTFIHDEAILWEVLTDSNRIFTWVWQKILTEGSKSPHWGVRVRFAEKNSVAEIKRFVILKTVLYLLHITFSFHYSQQNNDEFQYTTI